MSEMLIRFLGDDYSVPADIPNFLRWRVNEPKSLIRLLQELLLIAQRNAKYNPEHAMNCFQDDIKDIQTIMREEAQKYVQEALDAGAYSITETTILKDTGYDEVKDVVTRTANTFLIIAKANLASKRAGQQLAYNFASSGI